jgi:hypothetical protein
MSRSLNRCRPRSAGGPELAREAGRQELKDQVAGCGGCGGYAPARPRVAGMIADRPEG